MALEFLKSVLILFSGMMLCAIRNKKYWQCSLVFFTATVVKTEAGSLPEGKVRIKLEHDGTVLDVDEDDVEKVSCPG